MFLEECLTLTCSSGEIRTSFIHLADEGIFDTIPETSVAWSRYEVNLVMVDLILYPFDITEGIDAVID